ncbi:MAG: copper resistance CopC family protein [Sphingomicrobium sp.]
MRQVWIPALMMAALPGCAAQTAAAPTTQTTEASILARSTPSNGSTVTAPVNQLALHFARPARLLEVTVDGPDGLSPMMVTAAGETKDYTIPLPGLGAGTYRVNWKASAAGSPYAGVISFTVR